MSQRAVPRPLLVAGSHRSGTGWVAQILELTEPRFGYIWEPWNVKHRPGNFTARFGHNFHYVCAENEGDLESRARDMLTFHYRPLAELRTIRSPRDAGRMVRDWWRYSVNRRHRRRALVKDPIALYAAEWLAEKFNAQVVLIVRHPAAFCASLVHRGWRHEFSSTAGQDLLMRDWLEPLGLADEVRRHAAAQQSALDEAILLWNMLYATIAELQQRHPDWVVVRQEDLASYPDEAFPKLFADLDLPYTEAARALVAETTSATNATLDDDPSSIRRNSSEHRWNWTRQLNAEQIARIREATRATSDRFYGPEDWERDLTAPSTDAVADR